MEKSEQIEKLAAALAKAQGSIKPAIKDSTNPHFGNRYADLASVWDACREQLCANELSVVQLPAIDAMSVVVTTVLMHASGQWISSRVHAIVQRVDPQGVGSAITYLRRYALAAMVGIAPEDDDGEAAVAHRDTSPPRQAERARAPKPDTRQLPAQGSTPPADPRDQDAPSLELALRQLDQAKTSAELGGIIDALRPLKWTPQERRTISGAGGARKKVLDAQAKTAAKDVCADCGLAGGKHQPPCPVTEERVPGSEG